MKVLVSTVSKNILGLFNSIWCNIRENDYLPERVILFTRDDSTLQPVLVGMLEVLLEEHGVEDPDVSIVHVDGDLRNLHLAIKGVLSEIVSAGCEVALDATPGRKDEMITTVLTGWSETTFDRIFYTSLDTFENTMRPYILVPWSFYHPHDIIREVSGNGD